MVERKVVSRIGIPLAFCLFFLGCQTYLTAKEKTYDAEIIVADGGSPTPKLIAQLQRSPQTEALRRTGVLRPALKQSRSSPQFLDLET